MPIAECGYLGDRTAYLVMELLSGESLAAHREKNGGKLAESLAQHLIWQLAAALEAAHARDIVHRDLKPGHIMLIADAAMPSGLAIKLLDFGSAALGLRGTYAPNQAGAGSVTGTPLYLAPEEATEGEAIGAKADVYAMGALFFELLTGQPPFTAKREPDVRDLHVTQPAPSVHEYLPSISSGTATLIANMLEKEPKKRPSSGEVTQMLRLMGSSLSREQDTVIVPRSRQARKAGAELANSNKTEWIRRAPRGHEPMTVRDRRRLWGLSAILLFAGLGIVVVAVRSAYQSRATAGAIAVSESAAAPGVATAPGKAPTNPTQAPVSISIKSIPSGATVIDLDGEKKLGVTPFSASLDAQDKDLWLVLRKDGFNERVVQVSLRHDSERLEKLAKDGEPTHKPAARPTLEELKRRYESSARGSDLAKPRIVD